MCVAGSGSTSQLGSQAWLLPGRKVARPSLPSHPCSCLAPPRINPHPCLATAPCSCADVERAFARWQTDQQALVGFFPRLTSPGPPPQVRPTASSFDVVCRSLPAAPGRPLACSRCRHRSMQLCPAAKGPPCLPALPGSLFPLALCSILKQGGVPHWALQHNLPCLVLPAVLYLKGTAVP